VAVQAAPEVCTLVARIVCTVLFSREREGAPSFVERALLVFALGAKGGLQQLWRISLSGQGHGSKSSSGFSPLQFKKSAHHPPRLEPSYSWRRWRWRNCGRVALQCHVNASL